MTALLLSDDLIFSSRVLGAASEFGGAVRTARDMQALLKLACESTPACVIIDLSNPGLEIAALAVELKQLQPAPRLIAYGSHVETATLQAARDAGCDLVLARSQFVAALPQQLADWMKPNG